MTREQIELLLRIYDKCLKYGETNPNLQFIKTTIAPRELFRNRLLEDNFHLASYVLSREPQSKAREVLLYFVYRLKLLSPKQFDDLLFSVYNMTETNTSFNNFFSSATILAMFNAVNKPYLSKDNDFDTLPDELILYRGLKTTPTNIEYCGYSWTLKERIAIDFAFMNNSTDTGFLVKGGIAKIHVVGYLTNRGESEIIVPASMVTNKTVLSLVRK